MVLDSDATLYKVNKETYSEFYGDLCKPLEKYMVWYLTLAKNLTTSTICVSGTRRGTLGRLSLEKAI